MVVVTERPSGLAVVERPGLYVEESGRSVVTQSMIKTFRRCPKQAQYKYVERLKPKSISKPLRRGNWIHALFEAYYKGEDWEAVHRHLSAQFANLFDEEKEKLGDLPRECLRLFKNYLWHYASDPWKIHEIELTLETELPDGTVLRIKLDLLIENQYGLWLVDHKTHKKLPDLTFRLLDVQSAIYVWVALRNKIPVQGFIWNYVRTKAPAEPKLVKSGQRIARINQLDTDYPTLARFIKRNGLDPADYADKLRMLRSQRFEPGAPQTSPFFRRDILERSPDMLKRVAKEAYHTSRRMAAYPFEDVDAVERVVDRSCTFMCSYTDLCTMELFGGGNTDLLRRKNFTVGDPMDYYQDKAADDREKE